MPTPLLYDIELSIILIPYNNAAKFQIRLERDIIPTILAHRSWKFHIIIVDNSDYANQISLAPLYEADILPVYLWPGNNLMYGPAMNLASSVNPAPYMVYACSNHGHMYDPTWIDDLLNPLIENPGIAMTGSLSRSCAPDALGFPEYLPAEHIQGGIFCARTDAMKKYPYSNDERWVHWGSDVYQCFQLLNAGFLLCDVPTIKSVWRQNVNEPERWKYVHDYAE